MRESRLIPGMSDVLYVMQRLQFNIFTRLETMHLLFVNGSFSLGNVTSYRPSPIWSWDDTSLYLCGEGIIR